MRSILIRITLALTILSALIVPTYMILDSVTEVKSLQLGRQVDQANLPEYNEAKINYEDKKYIAVVQMVDLESGKGFCTGFIISDDYMISAAHCFVDPKTSKLNDKQYGARSRSVEEEKVVMTAFVDIVGVHVNADYAVLKGDFKEFSKLKINVSGSVMREWTQRSLLPGMPPIPVFAVGYPYGTTVAMAYAQSNCRNVYDFIECELSQGLFPGCSGGPVIDPLSGEVIGINYAMGANTKYFKHLIGIFEAFNIKVVK